jgi:hypothetical protein
MADAGVGTMQESSWLDWRQNVVAIIRTDFHDVLDDVGEDDVDWDAWRPLFDQGRTPEAAVDSAFLRAASLASNELLTSTS